MAMSLRDRLEAGLVDRANQVDQNLPAWARRGNPIVMRHLGGWYRAELPEVRHLLRLYFAQIFILLLSFVAPFVFVIMIPFMTACLFLLPFGFYFYLRMLLQIMVDAVATVTEELRGNTLELLRTTPYELYEILLSKAASALWRQMGILSSLLLFVSIVSLPVLAVQVFSEWPLTEYPIVSRLALMSSLTSVLLRLLLEPMMIAILAIALGVSLPHRGIATVWTVSMMAFYYLLVNLPRMLPLSWPLRFAVEYALPVGLPILLTLIFMRYAIYALMRDGID
ncbi:MAG: hypothetical protein OXG02_03550 [Chloroflexi bacterium]|nr:hypothetical protein [Chloroflexota bacterium]